MLQFSEYHARGGERGQGPRMRPPRESLRSDFTNGEHQRRLSTGRLACGPGSYSRPDILCMQKPDRRSTGVAMSPERTVNSPPPYGVGAGSPAARHTGRRSTAATVEMNKLPLRLTDECGPAFSSARSPPSPNRRALHAPADNLVSVFRPPVSGEARPSARSRSCPPMSLEGAPAPGKITSPLKTSSCIGTAGGCVSGGDSGWTRPGMRVHADAKHRQGFVVSKQTHAELGGRRSRSAEPGRSGGGDHRLPSYASKKRFGNATFSGDGTHDAMNWTQGPKSFFSRKRIDHQQSDLVRNVLVGRGNPGPARGRKGMLGHELTYRSHSVTVPSCLPASQRSPSKGKGSGDSWGHTRLW